MTRDQFLTVRWNNYLSLGLGVMVVTYVLIVLASSVWMDGGGFLGIVLIGSFF